MITIFKLFENSIIKNIEIGDFILVDPKYHVPYSESNLQKYLTEFLINNIGIVIKLDINEITEAVYVKFHNYPDVIKRLFNDGLLYLYSNDIKYYDKTIDGIKMKLELDNFGI